MNNPLSDLYEQILLNEAEKHALQNPSQDEVGNVKAKADLFGSKPKPVEGPDKANVKQGPSYKETTGSDSKPKAEKTSMPNSAAAKSPKPTEKKEMKGTNVNPKSNSEENEEDEEKEETKKSKVKEESFAMSSFETLFKNTLQEEMMPEDDFASTEETGDEDLNIEDEETETEDEGDLLSDLKDLQDKLTSILAKLEDSAGEDTEESEDYSEEDFDAEFDEEDTEDTENPVKESVDKPKVLNTSKGKTLMSKKNKVGKVNPKGGKAHTGKVTDSPQPKALGDRKGSLQKGRPEVKSSIKKGDFIK